MSKIDVAGFFQEIKDVKDTGQATEHSYRQALQSLLQSINPGLSVVNEPRQIECGQPDFVIMRGDVPVGYLEAKDLSIDIRPKKGANRNQQERYRDALANLIYTNGTDWDFYRHDADGKSIRTASVKIADYLGDFGMEPDRTQFAALENRLYDFVSEEHQGQTIKSSTRLAKIMAGKARLIRDALAQLLIKDEDESSDLGGQYKAFKKALIHDVTKEGFADIYAETIVYGMFAARYHDPTPENFSRQEALELLPKSNPFLRKLFSFIATNDLDADVRWIIDELARVFQATRVDHIMGRWSDANDKRDPFLHFYETFLAEYNPAKRKARGVWYTPEAVVNFIVRAVDDVLKEEFGLPLGLADTSKISVEVDTGQTKEVTRKGVKTRVPKMEKREIHRVQILDPATGTGTFLAEVIKQITPRIQAINGGGWSKYVERDLLPRLHGFELLMASYAMCHMKLDMMLTETGYRPTSDTPPRLSVYLTNSLEEGERIEADLFPMTRWLSDEAAGASEIKRDKPIMCIIGNPPYSGVSQNDGEFIEELLTEYKKEPGGQLPLQERRHWLNDDYVKFIRLSENMISTHGEGVLGFITNHGYLSNPTFRGMRWKLQNTFDKIYIFDLHGNSNRKEVSPDGTADENVFDISVGTSIFIGVKKRNHKGDCEIFHRDIWGKRRSKNDLLSQHSLRSLQVEKLSMHPRFWMFYPINNELLDVYLDAFSIQELFTSSQKGIISARDHFAIDIDRSALEDRLDTFKNNALSDEQVRAKYFSNASGKKYLKGDSRGWKIAEVRNLLNSSEVDYDIAPIYYRPFDKRWVTMSEVFNDWPRTEFMKHIRSENNFGLSFNRNIEGTRTFTDALVFDDIIQHHSLSNKEANDFAPLYIYSNDLDQTRRVNMDPKIRAAIVEAAVHSTHGRPDEVAIFDYIYGVLHCPTYRETYAEFLKIDFPRVPYPPSPDSFWDISAKGRALRELHLMDGVDAGLAYPFKGEGDNLVETIGKKSYQLTGDCVGQVWVNDSQYFDGIPQTAWDFYIGGYQPAQKWLKDRKGRELSFDDVMHYRKIIHILLETDRIMKTIEMDF